jgi:hypothetical protein
MEVEIWVRKSPVPVEIVTLDNDILLGDVFLAGDERVVDGVNSEREFMPFRTDDGEFQVINKSTVARIRPFEDGSPAKVKTRMTLAPVELVMRDGRVLCGSVFLANRDRVSDVFNGERFFVPLQMGDGELQIVNKCTVVRVKPMARDQPEQERPEDHRHAA